MSALNLLIWSGTRLYEKRNNTVSSKSSTPSTFRSRSNLNFLSSSKKGSVVNQYDPLNPIYLSLTSNQAYIWEYNFPEIGKGKLCFQLSHPRRSNNEDKTKFDTTILPPSPVVYFAGLAGSRLEQFTYSSDKTTNEYHSTTVITFDRPGYGHSTPLSSSKLSPDTNYGNRYSQVSSIISHLLKDLDVSTFKTVGWSSGGAYSLSLGHMTVSFI